jgi:hypothetical protein
MNMRVQDWPEQLAAWVDDARARAFEWGWWDCATAANDCVKRITGDALGPLGGLAWSGVIGAVRQLELEGGLQAAVTSRMGEPIVPAYAQRGDLVLLPYPEDYPAHERVLLAVCLGESAAAPGPNGLEFVSMYARQADGSVACRALCAWPVGR